MYICSIIVLSILRNSDKEMYIVLGNSTISKNNDEPVKTESKVEPKQSKQYLGIKPLQLLTEPKVIFILIDR